MMLQSIATPVCGLQTEPESCYNVDSWDQPLEILTPWPVASAQNVCL